jgi:hypothetical protein
MEKKIRPPASRLAIASGLETKGSAAKSRGRGADSADKVKTGPRTWEEIGVGHVVLAEWEPGKGAGWWQATVMAIDNDTLTLKWNGEPRQPKEKRHRLTVAILDPDAPDQLPQKVQ